MRNKYPGICYRCGGRVDPGAGFFEKIGPDQRRKWPAIFGTWHVQHDHCCSLFGGTSRHYIWNPGVKPYVSDEWPRNLIRELKDKWQRVSGGDPAEIEVRDE